MLNQNENGNGFAAKAMMLFALTFFVSVCAVWLPRGLPDAERVSFYPSSGEVVKDMPIINRVYKTGPLESFNYDEGVILNALSNMSPSKLDFNPRFFNYSTFFIYQIGAELVLLNKLNLLKLVQDKKYYFFHPFEIKKMYLAGRLTSFIYGLLTIFLVYKIIKLISGESFRAALGVLLLCLMPNWPRESSFMLPNVPETFFVTATVYLTLLGFYKPDYKKFFFAAALAGLAAGCKYPGGVIGLLPGVVFLFKSKTKPGVRILTAVAMGALAFGVFLLTTPYAIFDIFRFSSHLSGIAAESSKMVIVYSKKQILFGKFYLLLVPAGLGVLITLLPALWGFFKQRGVERWIILGWLLLGSWPVFFSNTAYMRYWTPALPAIAALCALFVPKSFFRVLFLALIPFSFIYTLHFNILTQIGTDPRIQAAHWIEANIPEGDLIATRALHYDMPPINSEKYPLMEKLVGYCPRADWLILRERYPLYRPCPDFHRIKTFSNRPFLFGIDTFRRDLGDLPYTHVQIDIYKRDFSSDNQYQTFR